MNPKLLTPLAVAVLSAPVVAQGTKGDYERALSLAQRTQNKVFRSSVAPHWLAGGEAFWYRVATGPDSFEFVFVDAAKGERHPAFDHDKLAVALAHELGQPVDAQRLPFTWLDMAPDGAWARFAAGDKTWQLDTRTSTLAVTTEPLHREQLPPIPQAHPSWRTGEATAITFVNHTAEAITCYWVDPDGKWHAYPTIQPGQSFRQTTYAGHVWAVNTAQNKTLAVFEARDDESDAILGDEAPPPKPRTEPVPAPERPKAAPQAPAPRPWTAFIRNHNVWTRDAKTGREERLSTNGTADDAYEEPLVWSPDGTRLAVQQVRPAQEHKVTMVESSPADQVQPKLRTINYLKPGDRIAQPRPRLFDLTARQAIPISEALFPNPWSISDLRFSPDGAQLMFLYNQRGHQAVRVVAVNTRTGAAVALVDEHSDTFIDYSQKTFLHWLDATNELIWMSERDGWNHLYLHDARTGQVKNQITRGAWVVREVEKVDAEHRQIWFKALGIRPGQDPYHVHLARVNFDGSGLTVLTEGDGTHRWRFSPDPKGDPRWLLDTWSRVDAPPVTELRRAADGQLVCTLEKADAGALLAAGWTLPERFNAKGRDGQTDIYGILVKPSNFDQNAKYPVIETIYSGPQDCFVPKAFETLADMHSLAELGFVVAMIDGMGTNWRSRAFHDVCWKNLKDGGLPDHIAWLRAAAATRPWLDLSRVGLYGGSAGGQNALAAMLWHGDFYQAAAADCGCHDNRMDKIWWNEAWMGWPVGPEYADNSNVTHAAQLQGKLLLTVGELDDNVDPASTMQVVNALIKADKDFELIVVPGAKHGAGGGPYGVRRRMDFFVRALLGVEPRL